LKTKIIFIDGPDVTGKTTLIENVVEFYNDVANWDEDKPLEHYEIKELNFNKGLTGLLRINTPTHFEILRVLLPNLDPRYAYIVDRCFFSNIVYDKVLRNESADASQEFRVWCKNNLSVLEIILDRDYATEDFNDDLIKVNKETFNRVVDEYRKLDVEHRYNILNNSENEQIVVDLIGGHICR